MRKSRTGVLVFAAITNNLFAAISNNVPGVVTRESVGAVNLLLGGWAVYNFCATVMLVAKRLPGRRLQLAAIGVDIAVASALVYLSGGFPSNLGIAFYMVVIASSLRFGTLGTLGCALAAGLMLPAAAVAPAAKTVTYSGTTSQHLHAYITANARSTAILNGHMHFAEHCTDGTTQTFVGCYTLHLGRPQGRTTTR